MFKVNNKKHQNTGVFIVDFEHILFSSLNHCDGTQTNNYLVRKRTLNHLAVDQFGLMVECLFTN